MRRRQVFAQRRRSALDPSGAAGSGPAAITPPPPVSREEEEKAAQIWTPYPPSQENIRKIPDGAELECLLSPATDEHTYRVLTPATDPLANAPKKRKTLRLKQDRDPWLQAKLDATADAKTLLPKRGRDEA
jgi:hypothetical protein